jgi:hypothetical protein
MALLARPDDLERVLDLDETVLCGHFVGPALDGRPVHLDRPSADAADEVVMVPAAAPSIGRLAVGQSQDVDLLRVGQHLQRAIDRRQADALTTMAEEVVDLLCAPEVVDLGEQRRHCRALSRRSDGGAVAGDDHVPILAAVDVLIEIRCHIHLIVVA